MSHQTLLDSFFKCRANVQPAQQQQRMDSKNKFKRRSLSLTRSHRPNKSPKKLFQDIGDIKTENEVITLSSSSEDLLTPPERRSHCDISSPKTVQTSKHLDSPNKRKTENEVITLQSASEDLLTPPERRFHCDISSPRIVQASKHSDSPNTSTDSSSTIIYNYSPQIKPQSSQTPNKTTKSPRSATKYFSPTKKRVVTKKSPAKRKLAFAFKENNSQPSFIEDEVPSKVTHHNFQDDKTLFLLSIIEKYLNDDSLRHLLHDESHALLLNCMQVEEPGMRVVCRLYWRQPGWYRAEQLEQIASEKVKISSPNMHKMLKSLMDNNLITSAQCEGNASMDFDDYVKLLKRPELQEICKDLKLKMQSKQDAVDALRKFSQSTAISNFFTGKMGNNKERVLKILRAKTGQCYKLSDVARNTLYKLYVLMYLGMDYTIIREKRLELILLHDKVKIETYPIDKNMVVDNASVVFTSREEFYRYLEAHLVYENYIVSTDLQEKCDIVIQTYKHFKEINEEHMLRYKSLPPWLRRFTPGSIYVKILESGVQELKKLKSEAQYATAIKILDSLIDQVVFRQHKKALWYAEKALILHKHLNRSEQAVNTLLEGFKSDLSEEAKDALRPRAKLIANQRNIDLDDELRQALRVHAEQEHILESKLPADHVYKQPMDNHNQRGKLKFEAHTEDGRTIVTAEEYCILHYTHNGDFTDGEHWEGRIVTTIFFLLFWDIIYTKPDGVTGIFLNHFQRHPLDMYSEHFYKNRKALIDERLELIEGSTDDAIIQMMQSRWEERPESEVSESSGLSCSRVCAVCCCLGATALAALCRRLALHYGYTHSGFPDLTLWNTRTKQIKFVEVKTDADKPSMKQLQWLQYLTSHNIPAGFCYVGGNTTRCKARSRDTALTHQIIT